MTRVVVRRRIIMYYVCVEGLKLLMFTLQHTQCLFGRDVHFFNIFKNQDTCDILLATCYYM